MRGFLILLLLLLPGLASAQMTATLIADRMVVSAEGRLTASGNVEVFHEGTRLAAAAITYDRNGDLLVIEGPILLTMPDGTILTATRAELDPRLENGVMRGARLIIDRQLQLAAARIDRAEGRFSQLYRTAATSCAICGDRAPLWDIRAERVVHDAEAQQLYFDNAMLRIRGLPVFWVPRMRLPDPTLDRAAGLMIPQLRTSNTLGVGFALPYFLPLGDSRDLQLTPYLSTETRTIEARFRQALRRGEVQIDTAISRDNIRPDDWRGMARAQGELGFPADFRLDFDLMTVSDPAYLLDYDLSDADRIDSTLRLMRVRADSLLTADLTLWQSLREGELTKSLPPVIAGAAWQSRQPAGPGTLTLGAEALAFARTKDETGPEGRDVLRVSGMARWQGETVFGPGLLLGGAAQLDLQARAVRDDPAYDNSLFTALPAAQVILRWPLIRRDGRAVQMLEPAVALSWHDTLGGAAPVEDSLTPELDEGNLLALGLLPGRDGQRQGATLAAGVTWTRIGARGGTIALTFGRLFQDHPPEDIAQSTGLAGKRSDWLLAGSLDLAGGLRVQGRSLVGNDLAFGRTEARLDWRTESFGASAAYVWLPADLDEARPNAVSEWAFATDWRVNDNWALRLDGRYDIANQAAARAGLGVIWSNECVTVDLSVARRYTETETADPSTSLGLSVSLNGFSAANTARPVAECRG